MIKQIFLNADECVLAAASHNNRTGEKCLCTSNITINNLGFSIEFPSAIFQYKNSIVNIVFQRVTPKPMVEMILSNYDSIAEFINNHSALINFI
jgi:hypothetical protein